MRRKYINDTIDQLNRTNAKVIGCIFNNVHKGIFVQSKLNGYYGGQYKYSYKYGKYGRYGRYGHYGRYGAYQKKMEKMQKEE